MIEIGEVAPDFSLPDGKGSTITLAQFRGQPVVLAFYPLAFTGG